MVAPLAGQAAFAQSEPVPPDSWARRQEIAQLGEITPNVAADFDPVLGTPTFIRSTTAFLTRRSGRTPAQIVADFVNDNPATFGVSLAGGNLAGAEQFTPATYRTIRDFETPSLGPTGVRHLTYQQTHNGQDIYGSLLTANITGDGMLVNIGSRFVPEPATPISAPACDEANRTVRDVVAAACDEVNDTRIADIVNLIAPEAVCAWDWKEGHAFQGVGETALWVRSVLHPVSASELVQAWVVRLPSNPAADDAAWECMVKHSDLSVLSTHNLTMHYCQPTPTTCPPAAGSSNVCFRVYADDAPVPGTPGLPAVPTGGADSECVMRDALSLPACGTTLTDDRGWVQVALADILPMSPFGWLNEGHTFIRTVDGQPVETTGFAHCYGYNSGVASQTCGNNVFVRVVGGVPVAGPNRAFDFALPCPSEPGVPANSPCTTAFQHWDAVAAQVFYLANVWHDRMYLLGFDEQAGNFQATNFGEGGNPASDPLEILGNGSPDRDYGNARFNRGQSEDGAPYVVNFAVMPMLGEVTPSRPAALDKTVVFHELTHTMIARLGVGSMEAQQAGGMHEGTADFFAIALTASPADDYAATYPVFSWPNRTFGTGYVSHYYFGARRYPYSQDMEEINPVTYGFIDPDESNTYPYPDDDIPRNPTRLTVARSELHAIGEVWASALLDARYRLSQDPSIGHGANDLLMQHVVDGLKLNPGQPTFLQARDAILQADMLRHGGVHHPRLWWAFARRGMGWGATSPPNGGARDVVQSTSETPANNLEVSFFFPDAPPLAIDTCGPTSFDVLIVGVAQPLTSVEVVLHGTGLPTTDAGLPSSVAALGGGMYRVSVGPGLCRQAWDVNLRAGPAPGPTAYREGRPMLLVAGILERLPGFPVTMEVDESDGQNPWTSGMAPPWVPGAPANTGHWERVDPIGGNVQPSRDATPGDGYQCWVTQNRINLTSTGVLLDDVDSDGDGVWLQSPEWVLATQETAVLEFQQWYASSGTAAATDVQWRVDVLRDGDVVQSRAYLPADVTGLAWRMRRIPFGTGTTPGAGHRAKFHAIDQPPQDTAVEGGLDDMIVYQTVGCADCCDADLNRDGSRDQGDATYLINAVATGESPQGSDPDFNRDGNVDQQDIVDLIDYVGGAPCPL